MIGLGRKTPHSPLQQLKIDPVRRTCPPYWLASSGGQRIFINIRGQYGIQKNIYIYIRDSNRIIEQRYFKQQRTVKTGSRLQNRLLINTAL